MVKKLKDTTLRKTTEAIGALNQIRIEIEHSKETLRHDQEERNAIELRVAGLKEELRVKLEEKKIIEEFVKANPVESIRETIGGLNRELKILEDNIDKQIEQNRIKEELELEDIRELKSDTIDTLNRINLELADKKKNKEELIKQIELLDQEIKNKKSEFEQFNLTMEKSLGALSAREKEIDSRAYFLGEEFKKLHSFKRGTRMFLESLKQK